MILPYTVPFGQPFLLLSAIFILFLVLVVAFLLYRRRGQQKLGLEKNKIPIKIPSHLIDIPHIFLSQDGEILCIGELMLDLIHRVADNATEENILHQPIFSIENKNRTLNDLLLLYKKGTPSNRSYSIDGTLLHQKSEHPTSFHMQIQSFGSKDTLEYIGISLLDYSSQDSVHEAHYKNTLSGLPNYNKAIADQGLITQEYAISNKSFAIAIISIDNFLEITAIKGYAKVQNIILKVANYLYDLSLKNNFKLYHIDRNDFLLIMLEELEVQDYKNIINNYKARCDALFSKNKSFQFTLSSGISVYPKNGLTNLIDSAYEALFTARKQGIGYTAISQSKNESLEKVPGVKYIDVLQAFEKEELKLYYQPIYSLKEKCITGAEALIRWDHPVKGILSPKAFLHVVENTAFMAKLGKFVTEKAIKQLSMWRAFGFREIQISINISLREFEAMDYIKLLDTLFHDYKVDPSLLKVELTENTAMTNEQYCHTQFAKLKKLGTHISLDDFGTGYSSFSMLRSLPIDTLKIDKSFIDDISLGGNDHAVIMAIITMAHALSIDVIAEGVESKREALLLDKLGCDYIQGYYFGEPMPTFEFQQLIRKLTTEPPKGDTYLSLSEE